MALPKPLRKGDGTRLRTGDAREALGHALDLLGEDAAQGGEDIRLRRVAHTSNARPLSGHSRASRTWSEPANEAPGCRAAPTAASASAHSTSLSSAPFDERLARDP